MLEVTQAIGQEEWQKAVIIIFDEMYIKDELVYDKQTGELTEFTNLGAINQQIAELAVMCIENIRLKVWIH